MEEKLKKLLERHEYEEFKSEIDKLDVTKENYERYLTTINDVIINQMTKEPFGGEKSSETRLINAFDSGNDEDFFLVVLKLRTYVAGVFRKKLNIDYVDDSLISRDIEGFESRFM